MKRSHKHLKSLLFCAIIGAPAIARAQDAGVPKVDKPTVKKPGTEKRPDTTVGTNGKLNQADTDKLPQFEQTMEFQPRGPGYKVSFSLEDADLAELVKTISNLTGKRFIFGAKVKSNIKANIYSPQKVTVAEAYQAFLSILEANGLTVVPMGNFNKIIETTGAAAQGTPISKGATTGEERYVTRMHRMKNVGADEVATLLKNFQSKDANVTVYGPGNLLIITDTGTNIRRMMQIVEEIDVGGAGDQIWIEPVHYASATEVATRLNELFDVKSGSGAAPSKGGAAPGSAAAGVGELHVAKILPDDRTGSLIIVATEKAYLRMLELIKKIDVPQTAEGEIHVIPLQHADAKELAKTIDGIVQGATAIAQGQNKAPAAGGAGGAPSGVFEGGIKVSPDEATNSLIVTSSLHDYASLRAVVDKLDQARRQVFIEAVIMDLSISRQRTLGFNWHGGAPVDTGIGSGDSLLVGGLNPLQSIGFPLTATALQGLALGIRGPGIPGTESFSPTGQTIPAFGVVLNALATSSDTDILSTPHILATDNIQAEISIGKDTPTQGNLGLSALSGLGGASGAAGGLGAAAGLLGGGLGGSVPRAKVGTKLRIKPHLNDSNEVRLEVEEEISDTGEAIPGNAAAIPIFQTTAKTNLIVQDQQTAVIGGLIRNRVTHVESKIPLLGDIPLLGALFRTNNDSIQKSNLILILTPYIIRDTKDLRRVFEQKMRERQEFLDRYFVFNPDQNYTPPKDYSRTSGLLEVIRQSYRKVDEQRKLDEIARPREIKVHEPGLPLEMPATIRPSGTTSAGQGEPPPPSTPVQAAPRPNRSIRQAPVND